MEPDSIREARKRQDRSRELAEKGWYHSFELPDGTMIDGVIRCPACGSALSASPFPAI